MLGVLTTYLEKLVLSILEPLYRWSRQKIRRLSWPGKILVLVALLAFCSGILKSKTIVVEIVRTVRVFSEQLNPTDSIQLRSSTSPAFAMLDRLKTDLQSDVAKHGNFGYEAWPIAQALVGLDGQIKEQPAELMQFFDSEFVPQFHCWRQIPSPGYPRHVPTSAWVLLAMAKLKQSPSPEQINFFLETQDIEGGWPTFPAWRRQEFASTYATALSTMALDRHLRQNEIPKLMRDKVKTAVDLGYRWLLENRVKDQARWEDYPNSSYKRILDGVSGIALYALHNDQALDTKTIDELWVDSLPDYYPSRDEVEISGIWFNCEDGRQLDQIKHVRLTWLLIGSAKAYCNVDAARRIKATDWIAGTLKQSKLLESEAGPYIWTRAETRLALEVVTSKCAKGR